VIASAPAGSSIVVPAGTITLLSGPLTIGKSLTITGAGAGSTIVSGGRTTNVMALTGSGNILSLSGLTVRDGVIRMVEGITDGAGLLVGSGNTAHIDHAAFINNAADSSGDATHFGGIADGGAIDNEGTLTLDTVSVVGNSALAPGIGAAQHGGIAQGGGIYSPGSLAIANSNVTGNVADADGGPGPATSNANHGGIAEGGGIDYTGSTPMQISNSTISSNLATGTGGPGSTDGIVLGGGIYAQLGSGTGSVQLAQSTVAANVSQALGETGGIVSGGGLYLGNSNPNPSSITDSTFAGNAASTSNASGSGGNIHHDSTEPLTMRNTIVSGGQGEAGHQNCNGMIQSLGYNIDSLNQCGLGTTGDQVDTDPRLQAPRDNGGPGPTVGFGLDSPAFNRGDPNNCPPADERGIRRPQGAGCDIGAFELELADLGLRGSVNRASVKIGSTVTLSLSASNGGSGTGHGTFIGESLPAGLTLVSANPSGGSCSGTRDVACVLGELAPGAVAGVQIVVRATAPGTHLMSPAITSSTVDPSAANNGVSIPVKVGKLTVGAAGVSPRTFHLGRLLPRLARVGTTIRFTLPEAARVKLTFARKRGKRFRSAGSLTVRGHPGKNKLRFQGRLSRHKTLKPGRYRVTLRAADRFGNRSAAKKLSFTLLP
jgi:uncharacterized repeat protein (TIGR01451 family)